MNNTVYYKRNLPHIQPVNSIFFVTFRLANSLPKSVIEKLQIEQEIIIRQLGKIKNRTEKVKNIYIQQKRYFGKFDKLIDGSSSGSYWLKDNRVAKIVVSSIYFYNNNKYILYCFCIMPNHVHLLFKPLQTVYKKQNSIFKYSVTKILQDLKKFTAKEANKILKRKGAFWHNESYDHVVRDKTEFKKIFNYILQNPVKAGLVKNWKEWRWTYFNPKFKDYVDE